MPIKRRHPLFLRLRCPLLAQARPLQEVAFDDEAEPEASEVGVYLATSCCHTLVHWAAQMRRRHRLDKTHETDVAISFLSLDPLRLASLREVGAWSAELYGPHMDRPDKTLQGRQRMYASQTLIAIAVQRATLDAVGFVSFQIRWVISAYPPLGAELEVTPDQAWIDPAFRGQRRGDLFAYAVSHAVAQHVRELEESARWGDAKPVRLAVTVGADIYSVTGQALLGKCADAVAMQFGVWLKAPHFLAGRIVWDPRW